MTTALVHSELLPLDSQCLSLTSMSLNNWGIVHVHGFDAEKYIQGQVTADVVALKANQHILTAHCNPLGRMWSNLRLFHHFDGFSYIARKSLLQSQLLELKKYAIFSNVTFEYKSDLKLLGIAGSGGREALSMFFGILPDCNNQVIVDGKSCLLHFNFPNERFLVITNSITAQQIINMLNVPQVSDEQWLSLDIEAGYPIIDQINSAKHFPQATNLQALPFSINFKKGCYIGQEMVARAKFRGVNKRAMYWLKGTGTFIPALGHSVEYQLSNAWRRTGTVLSAVKLANGEINVQIIMNNDIKKDSIFRIIGEKKSELIIQSLPYSIEK
ncbi:tRNA-modifying protein YgfZ [Candidatus Hartigia pinicola]|nr:tRNA-modifying protein YgfZ [Candidatus Hartigia pinicola]